MVNKLLLLRDRGAGISSPEQIAGLQLWLDASDLDTLFTDSAKTTPAGDTDVVGAWADKTTNGYDVLQTTTASKPTLQLDEKNGLPVVRFDGTDDWLDGGDILDLGTASMTMFVVGKATDGIGSTFAGKTLFGPGEGRYALSYLNDDLTSFYSNAAGNEDVAVAYTKGSYDMMDTLIDRSVGINRLNVNGSEIGNTPFTAESTDFNTAYPFLVGAYGSTHALLLTGDVAEVVLWLRALTTTEQGQIRNYLSNKWAVTLS